MKICGPGFRRAIQTTKMRRPHAWLIILAVLFLLYDGAAAGFPLETFERDHLTIETAEGERHEFEVELALTPTQQAQGLMYREQLAADKGMLFVYKGEAQRTMWMKNTLIPLDMLFISRDGVVLGAAERTVPLSLAVISSGKPAMAVLELSAGTASRLGITPGSKVLHSAFGTSP